MIVDDLLETGPVHIFHDQKVEIAIAINVVRVHDIRMVNRGNGLSFTVETIQKPTFLGKMQRQHFDRHAPAHQGMFGKVDCPHAAAAESFQNLVFADRKAAPFSLEQLFGVKIGEPAFTDENARRFLGMGRQIGQPGRQPTGLDDPALPHERNQFVC